MLVRVRLLLALVLLSAGALVGLEVGVVTPAWASSCPSPYNSGLFITSVTLTQSSSSSPVGKPVTFKAKVVGQDDGGNPVTSGVCVTFTVSGVNAMPAQAVNTDAKAVATFVYAGANVGRDSITVEVPTAQAPYTDSVIHVWTPKPTPSPTPSPTRSPTASPTPSPTASPTPSPTPSPTASPTPSPTASPTPSPTASPVPLASTFGNGSLQVDRPSTIPGGSAKLTGRDCPANAPVTYTVEGQAAGSSTSAADGTFDAAVQLPDTTIGEHTITVTCGGVSATVPIDLVVASSAASPGSTATVAAILVFFVLLGSVLFARPGSRRRKIEPQQ